MTITPIHTDRVPTEADLFPHLDKEDVCIYCGCFQTDEQAEIRTIEHITRDLLAVQRVKETLAREFGVASPGYEDNVYDLLCDLDTAHREEAPALTGTGVAR